MTDADEPGLDGRIITFYSYKGGAGRTMALANVAWILASNGARVLVVDWDLESPGLHRYFHPFLEDKELRGSPGGVIDMIRAFAMAATHPGDDPSAELGPDEVDRLARVAAYSTSLNYTFPEDGRIELLSAGRQVPEYSTRVSTFNWDDFYDRLGGQAFLAALRRNMRREHDFILIDSRTGLSDNAGICTVFLPDVLVNCFTMSTQSIDGAVAIARSVRKLRTAPIDIFPVPTRVEDGEQIKLERSRTLARHRFEPFIPVSVAEAEEYWGSVEIPYKIYYAYEEILAAFGDRPRQEGTLLSAYERLASKLTGVERELGAVAEATRLQWLAEFERTAAATAPGDPIVISYAPRDRIWAEWISAELRLVDQPYELRELRTSGGATEGASRVVALLSEEYLRSSAAERTLRNATARPYRGRGQFLVPLRLDGTELPKALVGSTVPNLRDLTAARAREVLLAALDLADVAVPLVGENGPGPRYPATMPGIWKVPARNPVFTGREGLLDRLRGRLIDSAFTRPVALTGLSGVGKTQIALEYAHRFAAHYDLVWWISADQPAIVRVELARLAGPLRLNAGADTTGQVDAVLQALRQGDRLRRWLIIFDNPDDPEGIAEFLPAGPGDVVITTRNPDWAQHAERIEVGVFARRESIELIARKIVSLSEVEADAVADRLGDLPLVVEQAAAWLQETGMPVRNYLELLQSRPAAVLAESSSGYGASAAATWTLSMQRLEERQPAAARLMELLAFFSPEPVPTWLLQTPAMTEELARVDRSMRDPLLHGSLIREIGRFALARVDPSISAVRVHRLVQSVIRDALSETDSETTRVQVQEILAAAAAARQGGADDQDNWSIYDELRPHLVPSGALRSREDAVRQLVITMVRFLRLRGDLAGSEELAKQALDEWSATGDETDREMTLRLKVQLANVLRTAGRDDESRQLSHEVTEELTELVGPDHPYRLEAAGGLAADLWSAGQYQEGLVLNRELLDRWREGFGEDHPRTLMAANNLAHAERLCGNLAEAVRLDADTLRRRTKTLGTDDIWTLWSAIYYSLGVREVGSYEEARDLLQRTVEECNRTLGREHEQSLRASRILAGTLRRMGRAAEAERLAAETYAGYKKTLGAKHRETMLAELEVACNRSAAGDHGQADELAAEVLDYYTDQYKSDNPYSLAAANDRAIFKIRAGDGAGALAILADVFETYQAKLGDEHPSTLICCLNLANACFLTGDTARAHRLDERTHARLRQTFGAEHPVVIAATNNLALSLHATGQERDAERLFTEAARLARDVLGPEHPNTLAIGERTRINTDIEPFTP
ncbi:FxSxx-COOH system tetratricopeptide repeat protein [Dactylosporangium sp. NPDC049140]|uniref:FxSxx-COOH system tetratricopeptide repeat protein n=1 Tax=Dactylosporangium sp. NPDC049140 TaxID=3155647 RepID=UPI0033C964CC